MLKKIMLLCCLLLVSCTEETENAESDASFQFYYPRTGYASEGTFCTVPVEIDTEQASLADLLRAYQQSPVPESCGSAVPDGWRLIKAEMNENSALIRYSGISVSGLERSLTLACLTQTLLQLENVNSVYFFLPGETEPVMLTQSDILTSDLGMLPAVVYGQTDIVDEQGHFLRHRRLTAPEVLTWRAFRPGMTVCHQAFFARTDLARRMAYNTAYRFSADYDWCIRLMREGQRRGLELTNVHQTVANYLSEGATTRHHRASLMERLRIMAHHYGWGTALAMHAWFVVRGIIKK